MNNEQGAIDDALTKSSLLELAVELLNEGSSGSILSLAKYEPVSVQLLLREVSRRADRHFSSVDDSIGWIASEKSGLSGDDRWQLDRILELKAITRRFEHRLGDDGGSDVH